MFKQVSEYYSMELFIDQLQNRSIKNCKLELLDTPETENKYGDLVIKKMRLKDIPAKQPIRVTISELYETYKKWCAENNFIPLHQYKFGRILPQKRSHYHRYYEI